MNELVVPLVSAILAFVFGHISARWLENRKTNQQRENLKTVLRHELKGNLQVLNKGENFDHNSRYIDAHFFSLSFSAYENCVGQIGCLDESQVSAISQAYMKMRPLAIKEKIVGSTNQDKIFREALEVTQKALNTLRSK